MLGCHNQRMRRMETVPGLSPLHSIGTVCIQKHMYMQAEINVEREEDHFMNTHICTSQK